MRARAVKKGRRRAAVTPLLFLAPSLAGISVMFLVPTLDVVRRSFFTAMGDTFVGLSNYADIFQNESFALALKNTGRFLVVCIPTLLMLSLAVALLTERTRFGKKLFQTTYLLPMCVPISSIVLIVQTIFHKNGLLTLLCGIFSLTPADWLNSDYAFYVLVGCYLWKNIGYNVVLWLAGLSSIPASYYEAARMDGASELTCFFKITLPLLSPTIFMTTVLALINSFKVFREAYLIAGAYPHKSIYMLQHILSNWFRNLDMQKISAAAVLVMAAIFVIVFLTEKLSKGGDDV